MVTVTRRIYLATSWRNELQPRVLQALRDDGHLVYDFRNPADEGPEAGNPRVTGFSWSNIDPDWELWTPAQQIKAYQHHLAQRGLQLDYDAMRWADAFVMLQPAGRSAALELGWAIGARKLTAVLLAPGQEPELMIRLADHLTGDLESLREWLKS